MLSPGSSSFSMVLLFSIQDLAGFYENMMKIFTQGNKEPQAVLETK